MVLYAAEAPNWADKLEAWSTFGGAIFTAAAVIVAFLVWRHDQRLRREERWDAEAAQARLVLPAFTGVIGDPDEGWLGLSLTVSNNSAAPIFGVRVSVELANGSGTGHSDWISRIPASTTDPGEAKFVGPITWPFQIAPTPGDLARIADVQISFTDSSGRGWTRVGRSDPLPSRLRVRTPRLPILFSEYVKLSSLGRWIVAAAKRAKSKPVEWMMNKLEQRAAKRREAESPWTLPPPLSELVIKEPDAPRQELSSSETEDSNRSR